MWIKERMLAGTKEWRIVGGEQTKDEAMRWLNGYTTQAGGVWDTTVNGSIVEMKQQVSNVTFRIRPLS